jgi:hypothetical protein
MVDRRRRDHADDIFVGLLAQRQKYDDTGNDKQSFLVGS